MIASIGGVTLCDRQLFCSTRTARKKHWEKDDLLCVLHGLERKINTLCIGTL